MSKYSKRFLFLFLLSVTRASPNPDSLRATNLIEGSLTNRLPNSTLAAVIPDDFRIKPSLPLDEPVLDQRDTLFLTLETLKVLALDDFNQEQQAQTFRTLQHVAIDVVGPEATVASVLARKYAIWGIYKAVQSMVALRDFRPRNYELFWQGTLVGYVSFNTGPDDPLGIVNGTTDGTHLGGTEGGLSVATVASANTSTASLGNGRTRLSYQLYGRTIGEFNVFMTVFTCILKAAPFPQHERVEEFFVNSRSFNSFLSFKERDGLGPRGPFVEYEQLIPLLVQLPRWMVSQGSRWTEADMAIFIGNKRVGEGALKWQIRPETSGADSGGLSISR